MEEEEEKVEEVHLESRKLYFVTAAENLKRRDKKEKVYIAGGPETILKFVTKNKNKNKQDLACPFSWTPAAFLVAS